MRRLDRQWRLGLDRLARAHLGAWSGRWIVPRATGDPVVVGLRYLGPDDLAAMLALQAAVRARLGRPGLLRAVAADTLARVLAGGGCCAGALVGELLVGYGAIRYDVAWADNQGRAIGLADADFAAVAQTEGLIVDPRLRGGGVGRLLNEMRLVRARAEGRHHAIATISPYNRDSLTAFVPTGLFVEGLARGSGDAARYYTHDDLVCDVAIAQTCDQHVVPTGDFAPQEALLAAGLVGVAPVLADGVLSMTYARIHRRPTGATAGCAVLDGDQQ